MSEPVRVLQVIGVMNRGGAEAMIMNLYRKIDRTKVQFDFIENTFEKAAYDHEIREMGGIIYNCPHFTGRNCFQYRKWWKRFFQEHKGEYHVIHGHIGSTAAIYLMEAKKAGLFTIAHSHNSGTDYSLISILYSAISFPTRYIADYFFACSEIAGRDRFGKRVTSGESYSVLHNAISTENYAFNKEIRDQVRTEMSVCNERVVGHIGRFETQKNHRFLIAIFKEISKRYSAVKFLLVGDGYLRKEIERLVSENGLQDYVVFTGVRSDVSRIMQAMDCFVFPSLYEGLPVTMVEAQTAGLPCVMSEKVPTETILTKELVTVMPLSASAEEWAEHIISRLDEKRCDHSEEVRAAGYDISVTAKWLEDFYIERHKQN